MTFAARLLCLFALTLCTYIGQTAAQELNKQGDQKLLVVVMANRPPILFKDSQGRLTGYQADIWKKFQKQKGIHVELLDMPWAEAKAEVVSGRADAIDLIDHTPENDEMFDFSLPYLEMPVSIFASNRLRGIREIDDVHGFTIGAVEHNGCVQHLKEAGVTDIQLYPTAGKMLDAAQSDELLAFCIDQDYANYELGKRGLSGKIKPAFVFYRAQMHIAVRKGNTPVLKQLEDGLSRITPAEKAVLSDRWLEQLKPENSLRQWIRWLVFIAFTVTIVLVSWVYSLRQAVKLRTSQLQAKEANLRAIFDASPDVIWVSDRAGLVVEHNAQLQSLVINPNQPVKGRKLGEMFDYEQFNAIQELHYAIIATGQPKNLLVPIHDKQDKIRQLEVSKVALPGADGLPAGVLSVGRDVTERLQTEHHLRLWANAFQQAAIGIAIFDTKAYRILAINPAFARDREYSPEQMIGQSPDILYPQNLIEKRAAIRRNQDKTKVHWSAETEHITRTGRRFPVRIDVTVYHDANGDPINSLVFATDITEQRLAEQERIVAAVSFETSDAMLITDAQRTIQKANQAFCELTGYAANEIIGKCTDILRTDHHDDIFYEALWEEVARKGLWKGQRWVAVKTGLPHVMRMTISAVKNDINEITHYVYSMSDIAHEKEVQASIEKLSFYDSLTGLPNLAFLRGRLAHHLNEQGQGVLMMLDIDRFKQINDLHDHVVGDKIIAELGKRLENCFNQDAIVCRFGGGTFIVMLYANSNETQSIEELAIGAIEQTHSLARRPFAISDETTVSLSVSIGWTFILKDEIPSNILRETDLALYSAKALGRNIACRYQQVMQEELERREQLLRDLRVSIEQDDFILYLQAQVDHTGNIAGAEVLLRWVDSNQEMVSPSEFIPLAEQAGIIIPIGTYVLKSACHILHRWSRQADLENITLSVNVSAKQLADPLFLQTVKSLMLDSGIDATKLKLEITESAIVEDMQQAIEKLTALRALGIQISMDDFGTGYSSLSALAKLPLDQVKIDQSFIRMLGHDQSYAPVVDAIIAMGIGLNLNVIAEGVETNDQLNYLVEKGCHAYQGYLFARPMSVGAFELLASGGALQIT